MNQFNHGGRTSCLGFVSYHQQQGKERQKKMKTSKKLLQEALEFEKDCQQKYIKQYPTYLNELQSYAHSKGFFNWDAMIREIQND